MSVIPVVAVCGLLAVVQSSAGAAAASPPGPAVVSTDAGYLFQIDAQQVISSSWVVPTVTCPKPDASVSFAIGIANVARTKAFRMQVDADCTEGQPSYHGWYKQTGERRRTTLGNDVHPGDMMDLEITSSDGQIVGDMINETVAWSSGISVAFSPHPATALAMTSERRSADGLRPLANFTAIDYTNTFIAGAPITGPIVRVVMRGDGVVKAKPTGFDRQPGNFTVNWLHR